MNNTIEPKWVSKCGRATLYCGDCLEIMPALPADRFDVTSVVTDPPYGINTKSDSTGKINPWADLCNSAHWYRAWLEECRRQASSVWSCLNWRSVVTFQKAACDAGFPIESLLVWDKCCIGPGGIKGLRPSYELVAFWSNGASIKDRGLSDVQRFKWSGHKPNGHPAEKPVELMEWCINAIAPEVVIDPFMGSGTTGVAALRTDRSFVGIEYDRDHYNRAKARIERELNANLFLRDREE